ncbi:MAG: hypothetical protein LC750_18765 [Actinobacteria bacterium]|nr:hypothetical protein [Actinomycetota bacterium]
MSKRLVMAVWGAVFATLPFLIVWVNVEDNVVFPTLIGVIALLCLWRAFRMRLAFDNQGVSVRNFLTDSHLKWEDVRQIRIARPVFGMDSLCFVTTKGRTHVATITFEPGKKGMQMWSELKRIAGRKHVEVHVGRPRRPGSWLRSNAEWRNEFGDRES